MSGVIVFLQNDGLILFTGVHRGFEDREEGCSPSGWLSLPDVGGRWGRHHIYTPNCEN